MDLWDLKIFKTLKYWINEIYEISLEFIGQVYEIFSSNLPLAFSKKGRTKLMRRKFVVCCVVE